MHTTKSVSRFLRVAALALLAAGAVSCGLEKQTAPALAGPSEFATSIALTATPDIIDRDGSSQSTITVTARDANGAPLPNQRLRLGLNPSNGGVLSAGEVVTGPDGRATVLFTAPSLNTVVDEVQIFATPVGTDFGNAASRLVTVRLSGPGAAFPSFVFAPNAPEQFELTVFDASGTIMDGQACDSRCAYEWTFGSDGSGSGQVVSYRFRQAGAHTVTLTVTSPGGILTRSQRSITVGAATLPTAEFTYSPTDPVIGDTVRFNAESSEPVPGSGATIVEYLWDFGNGSTASGRTASTSFPTAQTYVVRLTIRDSNGLTATVTQDVAISEP